MSELSPIINLDYEPTTGDPNGTLTLTAEPSLAKISIVKTSSRAIIPDRRQQLLRRIGNAQAEIGRLNKLLDEIRADVLHLTTE